MRLTVLMCVFAFVAATCAWSQSSDHWEDYEPRTLQSIIAMHVDDVKDLDSKEKVVLLTGDSFRSRVRLIYLGDSRPLSAKRSKLLDFWRKMLKDQAPPADVFSTEVLFKEGADEHWIVVQKPLLDALPKEVKRGQPVNAYVIWIGAIKVGKQWEWLFAMNEFDAR